ncbi:MAG TPA: glycosyltransferase family 39 protein [Vicinamibacterales bacterium]
MNSTAASTAAIALVLLLSGALYFHRLAEVPVYVSTDEAKLAVQAHSLATTGRDLRGNRLPVFVLIVDPLLPEQHSVAWWQPALFYSTAGMFKLADVSAWSTRVPVATLALLNVFLIYVVASRWLASRPLALFAASALALTPSHFILGREAADYFCPTTVALLWLAASWRFLERRDPRSALILGLVLGVGLYTYITSWVVMPMYLALTILAAWRQRIPINSTAAMIATFACCAIPAVIWVALHPSMLTETLTHYKVSGGSRALERITLYWDYFNPSYLFFSGGSSLLWSTRTAGVFLLPFVVLLPAGLWALIGVSRSAFDVVLVASFLLVPLPIVLAMPEAPFYATARAILAAPLGVLIATAGVAALAKSSHVSLRTVAFLAIVWMPWQFSSFVRDYLNHYPQRSASWIDVMNFAGVARYVIENANGVPAVYLSHDDIGEDKAVKWKFHLIAAKRLDLWARTKYLEPDEQASPAIETASLLIMSPSNARVRALTAEGWSLATTIQDAAGTPSAAVLRKR